MNQNVCVKVIENVNKIIKDTAHAFGMGDIKFSFKIIYEKDNMDSFLFVQDSVVLRIPGEVIFSSDLRLKSEICDQLNKLKKHLRVIKRVK
jgi:hypothetical protein